MTGIDDLSGYTCACSRAPRHEPQMYRAAATQHNLEVLASRGCSSGGQTVAVRLVVISVLGEARSVNHCGYGGSAFFARQRPKHLNIMITAGPTREPLDPVLISLITAPARWVLLSPPPLPSWRERHAGIRSGFTTDATVCKRVDVMTALEMEAAVNASVRSKIFLSAAPPWRIIAQLPWPRENQKAGHAG